MFYGVFLSLKKCHIYSRKLKWYCDLTEKGGKILRTTVKQSCLLENQQPRFGQWTKMAKSKFMCIELRYLLCFNVRSLALNCLVWILTGGGSGYYHNGNYHYNHQGMSMNSKNGRFF